MAVNNAMHMKTTVVGEGKISYRLIKLINVLAGVGKTCFILSQATGNFPGNVQTELEFGNHLVQLTVDGAPITFGLWYRDHH
jgi:hypothetical protein